MTAVQVSNDSPVLLDHFLNAAVEVDIDAVSDGKTSCDRQRSCSTSSRRVFTPVTLHVLCRHTACQPMFRIEMREQVKKRMALELGVVGLMKRSAGLSGR